MNVISHPTYGMNIDVQLSTNARNVGPQFGAEFALDGFVPSFRTEYDMHHVLRVGMGHVPHLRCSASYIPRTQRFRAGLTYAAPPALEETRMLPSHPWKKRECSLLIPALTRWAKVCRASGAGRKANALFSSQRLRAGLRYAAPPALEERQMLSSHPIPALTRWAKVCRASGAGRSYKEGHRESGNKAAALRKGAAVPACGRRAALRVERREGTA